MCHLGVTLVLNKEKGVQDTQEGVSYTRLAMFADFWSCQFFHSTPQVVIQQNPILYLGWDPGKGLKIYLYGKAQNLFFRASTSLS